MEGRFLWQRNRDSNPNIQSQSLLCYRYTIPQYVRRFSTAFTLYTDLFLLSTTFGKIFEKNFKFFSALKTGAYRLGACPFGRGGTARQLFKKILKKVLKSFYPHYIIAI